MRSTQKGTNIYEILAIEFFYEFNHWLREHITYNKNIYIHKCCISE